MTVITNSEFAKRMLLLAEPAGEFRPTATYDPDGDCIEFFAEPDPFYAERVDDLVTVYYSQDTREVIGSLIKSVTRLCRDLSEKMPGFKIEIQDGHIRLHHLFLARLWASQFASRDIITLTYRKLIKVSGDTIVEGELCLA